MTQHLKASPVWRSARRVALYRACDGEADPAAIARLAWAQGKRCYLPRIQSDQNMQFLVYRPAAKLTSNRFGIAEPGRSAASCLRRQLDIILVPLVAYDDAGNRLGMGAGFYDRYLAGQRNHRRSKPLLLGLAHSFQRQPSLRPAAWDIPLDGVVTERGLAYSRKSRYAGLPVSSPNV